MAVLVTGGAGFVASTLTARLLSAGESVVSLDNLSCGVVANIQPWLNHPNFFFERAELSDLADFRRAWSATKVNGPITAVWHLAANSDIPRGCSDPDVDLRDTFLTTFNTLKLADEFSVARIYFASSSAIYGDLNGIALTEDTGPLFPISNYGAMKLASEAAISAAAERFLERALIFRFPNVVGVPATHGVIFDFMRRLRQDPRQLEVLGDGTQQKAYLHVSDLVDAMLFLRDATTNKVAAVNIGQVDGGVTVREIAEEVVAGVAPGARVLYGSGNKGWVGDVPRFRYSTAKIQQLGWRPKLTSIQAVRQAIREIEEQLSAWS